MHFLEGIKIHPSLARELEGRLAAIVNAASNETDLKQRAMRVVYMMHGVTRAVILSRCARAWEANQ
jgi:hypothetical protein